MTTTTKNTWRWDTLVLLGIVLLTAYKTYLIATGAVSNIAGDASARVFLSNYCGNHFLDFVTQEMWRIHWPPGQFLLLGLARQALRIFPFGSVHQVTLSLMGAVLSFAAAQYLVYLIGKATDGPRTGFFAFLIISGAVLPNYVSLTALAESYGLPYLLLGILYFIRFAERRSGILPSACFFLLGSLFRAEYAAVAGLLAILLLARKAVKPALLLLVVATAFWAVRLIAGAPSETVSYLNAGLRYYTFPSGLAAWRTTFRALAPRFMNVYQPYVWTIGGVYLVYRLLSRKVRIYSYLFLTYSAFLLLLCFLGLLPPVDRYMYISVVCFAFIAAAALGHLLQIGWLGRKPLVVMGVTVLFSLILLGIDVQNLRSVEALHARHTTSPVIETRNWLRDHLKDEDTVFFDFVRYYGIYFRSHLDRPTLVRSSFDYTTFYTRLPPVRRTESYREKARQAAQISDNAMRTAQLMRVEGYHYLLQYRPRFIVVAGPALFRRISVVRSSPVMLRPYLENKEEEGFTQLTVPDYPGIKLRLKQVFSNQIFEIYEVI